MERNEHKSTRMNGVKPHERIESNPKNEGSQTPRRMGGDGRAEGFRWTSFEMHVFQFLLDLLLKAVVARLVPAVFAFELEHVVELNHAVVYFG